MGDFLRKMVERVEWFSPIDYEILSFYDEHDILASPAVVAANIDYSRQYTGRRFRTLTQADLLHQDEGSDLYALTDMARKFLNGELAAEELQLPEDSS